MNKQHGHHCSEKTNAAKTKSNLIPLPYIFFVFGEIPNDNVGHYNAAVTFSSKSPSRNAVVTPLCKAASYEPRIAILGILGDTWLTRGKYGIYVAARGSYGVLTGST